MSDPQGSTILLVRNIAAALSCECSTEDIEEAARIIEDTAPELLSSHRPHSVSAEVEELTRRVNKELRGPPGFERDAPTGECLSATRAVVEAWEAHAEELSRRSQGQVRHLTRVRTKADLASGHSTKDAPGPESSALAGRSAGCEGAVDLLIAKHAALQTDRIKFQDAISWGDHVLWALLGVMEQEFPDGDAVDHTAAALKRFREKYPAKSEETPSG